MVCSYIFLLDLYKYSSSWLHSDLFFDSPPSVMESFPFYTLLFFHPRLSHVDQIANLLDIGPISTSLKSLWVAVRLEVTIQVSLPH